jgi:hypothetical protein
VKQLKQYTSFTYKNRMYPILNVAISYHVHTDSWQNVFGYAIQREGGSGSIDSILWEPTKNQMKTMLSILCLITVTAHILVPDGGRGCTRNTTAHYGSRHNRALAAASVSY